MPELPEVETIKEQLKKELLGKKILKVKVLHNNIIEFPDVNTFISNIKNQTINNITRQGKWLMFELDDYYLLSHLRMEGKYLFKEEGSILNKHEHVIFTLDNKIELRYKDTRKFGKMHLIKKGDIFNQKPLNELGLEPFSNELTISYLKNKFKHKTISIKTSLLDQKIITGIGNIYADEILFLSNISPLRKTNEVTDKELQLIINNTKEVLNNAILAGGTTVRTYTWKEGEKGHFQNELTVYGKKDKPCPKCQGPINKTIVNGRGTHYCPICQK